MEDPLGTDFSFQVGAKTSGPNQIGITINGMGSKALGLEADPNAPAPAPLLVHQATVSATGVVTENNENTSVTLRDLGTVTRDVDHTPALPATAFLSSVSNNAVNGNYFDTLTVDAAALAKGFTLTFDANNTVTAAPGGTLQEFLNKITATVGRAASATGSSNPAASAADAGHGFTASAVTSSGRSVITLTAGGAATFDASNGTTTKAASVSVASYAALSVPNITADTKAYLAGFTVTLESGIDVVAKPNETAADLVATINAGTGIARTNAAATHEGHGYSAKLIGSDIVLSAAGAITLNGTATTAAGDGTLSGLAVSTVTVPTEFLGDVTYEPNNPASVNDAVDAINAATADTNIVATVGADGSGNSGKIVLTHNGGSATGIGSHADITNLQDLVAFDEANTKPFAEMHVSGTTGILTFNEDATSIDLVFGKTTTTGAAGANSSVTIDATADLQTAVDAINSGTTEHGYTASIVAAPGGGSLAGTIKLVQGTPDNAITQTALADFIDNGDFGVGAIANQPSGPAQDMDVKTLAKALETIVAIDGAIKTVNIQRSDLGAVSNRLSHTINNLTNISTNLSAAQGGIEDADFAHETTMLAKNQILQQASTAMLAQANASKQNVLSLLQG
jgi:flagellin